MYLLCSLSVSLCQRMASNALLMSIVVRSVLTSGLFQDAIKTCYVRLISNVLLEVETRVVWEQGGHLGV